MIETNGKYYLGRVYDHQLGMTTDKTLLYDPDDLTTHAVVVGMTGSGKTGLCLDLLEEAALQGTPAIMIDPKGDITNALLNFPDLLPSDFEPWVNAEEARRAGKTTAQAAAETAALWKKGLAQWDITGERLQVLKNAAHFTVFTPGSDAGVSISILASLKAPQIPWETNQEILREKISGTVTALLGLIGLKDIDPIRSKEHILLANIFEAAWSSGKDLDMAELIMQVQNPPFEKLGVFDINRFFPENERFELAMLLNNILASPGFQAWVSGVPLDIETLLYGPDGRPRHSVFYIAHLSDDERMFFVTLLYSAVETWMRTKSGTTTLRALIYFDEIFGYLPPSKNPPSKMPMLRLLKQARAFGVGMVLVTQNPVDLDYKGLSNTGTWFIGKLQTDRDKERLLDGLEGASKGNLNRSEFDALLSSLGSRVFLLHNVHETHPQLFQTRWAMNYLAGPLTRLQLPALNGLHHAGAAAVSAVGITNQAISPQAASTAAEVVVQQSPKEKPQISKPEAPAVPELEGSLTPPVIPNGIGEYYLPHNLTLSQAAKAAGYELAPDSRLLGILYRPSLVVQCDVRYANRKYNLDLDKRVGVIVEEPDDRGVVRWDEHAAEIVFHKDLDRGPVPNARFSTLSEPFSNQRMLNQLERDFEDWVYRSAQAVVRAHETLKVYAGPNISQAEFRKMCADSARDGRDQEIAKVNTKFERELDRIEERLAREQRELAEDEAELEQRKMEEYGTHAENILSLFSKRKRRMTTSLTKRRMTQQAKADVEESIAAIEEMESQIKKLELDRQQELQAIQDKWADLLEDVTEIPVQPYKKDIRIDLFGVGWLPYLIVDVSGRHVSLPGYGKEG